MDGMTGEQYSLRSARVRFDPNDLAPGEPQYHITFLSDADATVFEGEVVVAVQASDDEAEPDLVGTARVARIDYEHGLIYLEVLRGSFREETKTAALAFEPSLGSSNATMFASNDCLVA